MGIAFKWHYSQHKSNKITQVIMFLLNLLIIDYIAVYAELKFAVNEKCFNVVT